MARALALLTFGLLLAGCAAPSETALLPASVSGLLPANVVAEFNAVVDAKGGQGEPSLGVSPDGTLWTHGPSDGPVLGRGGGMVYKSTDGGRTWEAVGAPNDPFPDLDPDLAVDKDGTIWDDILYVGCNSVAVSRDDGATWSRSPAVCNGPVGDRQYVIPTQGGEAYLYYHQLPSFQQTVMKTTDYGTTWLPSGPAEGLLPHHLLVDEGSGWGGGGFWNEKTGSVFLTYSWFSGGLMGNAFEPAASVTRDGLTWEVTKAPTAGGDPIGLSLVVGAADSAGNVYLAWAETVGEDTTGIFLSSSTDDGVTWSAAKRVDAGTGGVILPAIAARGPGQVAVAYYEADRPTDPEDSDDAVTWNVTLATTSDALAENATWTHGLLSDSPVKTGSICVSGSGCSEDREFLDYFALKFTPDGRAVSVWTSLLDVEDEVVNVVGATALPVFP